MRGNQRSDGSWTMRETVKSVLFPTSGPTTIEECRRCGKTIEHRDSDCPACGCAETVTYEIT